MNLLVVALLVTGCGRLAFDDRADAGTTSGDGPRDTMPGIDAPPHGSLTHDEDGDGMVDGIDNCPHLTGDFADRDGDGVGDLCDPEIDNPRQRIALFESFENIAAAGPLTIGSGGVQRSDAVGWTTTTFGFVEWSPHAVTDVDIAVSFDILSIPGTATHQMLIGTDQAGGTQTYGEVYSGAGGAFTAVTNFDGTNYNNYDMNNFAAITTGRVNLSLHAVANPRAVTFSATWMGMATHRSTTATAPYGPASALGVSFRDLDVELRYLLVIESN